MNEVTLCQETHREAVQGACPVHHGDACLRQYAPVSQQRESFIQAVQYVSGAPRDAAERVYDEWLMEDRL